MRRPGTIQRSDPPGKPPFLYFFSNFLFLFLFSFFLYLFSFLIFSVAFLFFFSGSSSSLLLNRKRLWTSPRPRPLFASDRRRVLPPPTTTANDHRRLYTLTAGQSQPPDRRLAPATKNDTGGQTLISTSVFYISKSQPNLRL